MHGRDHRPAGPRRVRHNSDIRRLKGVTEKDIKQMIKYHELHMELDEFRRNYQGAPA